MENGIPMMLSGDALSHYTLSIPSKYSCTEKVKTVTNWFSSDEMGAKILRPFLELKFSTEMCENPDKSEISVFRSFTLKLSSLQKQLDTHYHHDDFLKDQLTTSVDCPQIQQ